MTADEHAFDDANWLHDFGTACARRTVDGVGAWWLPPPVGRWLQIVMMPSFHADVVITAIDDGTTRRLVAQTAQCNLSNWDEYSKHPDLWPSDSPLVVVPSEVVDM